MDYLQKSKLISIIVPIYNVQNYLGKCIESISNQSYSNIEIILIDDGSEDDSLIVCNKYAEKDKRIKVVHQENRGVIDARKAGIRIAQGNYIVCVDGDDWIEQNRIHKVVDSILLSKSEPDMIYMSGYVKEFNGYGTRVHEDIEEGLYCGDEIAKKLCSEWIDTKKCFKNNICFSLCMWAIKKELLLDAHRIIDYRITIGEDYFFIFICLVRAKIVKITEESGYHYLQRLDSITHTFSRSERFRLRIWYQQLNQYLISAKVSKDVMKTFVFSAIRLFLMTDYMLLLEDNKEYLYPFTRVCKNSRIVVYGIGRMGCALVNALKECRDYEVVGVVDQKVKPDYFIGIPVYDIYELYAIEYDYIVISILDEDIAKKAKEELGEMGIEKGKIALMDRKVIFAEMIPESFRTSEELYV